MSSFSSRTQPMLSIPELTKLTRRSARREAGVFVIEGKKLVQEALIAGMEIQQLLVTEKFRQQQQDFWNSQHLSQLPITLIAEHSAQRLADTTTPPGIFAVVTLPEPALDSLLSAQVIVAFENIRDPGNLGTMIRTADWFGARAILADNRGADLYNEREWRATMGSLFHVTALDSENFVADLQRIKDAGFTLIVTRPEATLMAAPSGKQKICIVMGNESTGTSAEVDALADFSYAIPKKGQAESLNVSVSFGIALFELTKGLAQ